MSASIVVTDLAWSTPDGRPLFTDLNLAFGRERAGLVGRNGVGKTTLLRLLAGELKARAGRVTVNGRVAVLRQTLAPGETETLVDLFGVAQSWAVLARAAAGAATADDLEAADWTLESRISAALGRLGLDAEPSARLAALSGGQRTRAALAALVFAEPDMLLLDEPTNNLDAGGRAAVAELLAGWTAGAIVVSHDRALLEPMDAIVELSGQGAQRFGGGWSAYRARKALELAAAEHDLTRAEKRVGEVTSAAQAQAERQARKDAGGARKAARGDMPKILLGARKARAQQTGGDQVRLAGRRAEDAKAAASAARARIEVVDPLSAGLAPTRLAGGKEVLRLDDLAIGHGVDAPLARGLSLTLTGPARLAVVGANGAGKSTLLGVIAGRLTPLAGEVRLGVPFALLDQGVTVLDPDTSILENFRRLNDGAGENACRAALARFRFRADAALQSVASLSGGQRLRAGLACVLGGPTPPSLLILDEPTNHLDLDSIEAMEVGLAAYDGAMVVVSHDEAFLAAIGVTQRLELPSGSSAELAWP